MKKFLKNRNLIVDNYHKTGTRCPGFLNDQPVSESPHRHERNKEQGIPLYRNLREGKNDILRKQQMTLWRKKKGGKKCRRILKVFDRLVGKSV
jgi:hypothetical protein